MHIPNNIPLNQNGVYCLQCFSKNVKEIKKDGLTYYFCDKCGGTFERSLVIDDKITWWVDEITGEYWHETVGIIVYSDEDKILLFERVIYPFLFTVPSGHLNKGEQPELCAKRELKEETGMVVDKVNHFITEDIKEDRCRRGSDAHRWHLYTTKIKNYPKIELNREGGKFVWVSIKEALELDLTYPVKYFLNKYGQSIISN